MVAVMMVGTVVSRWVCLRPRGSVQSGPFLSGLEQFVAYTVVVAVALLAAVGAPCGWSKVLFWDESSRPVTGDAEWKGLSSS